MYGKICTKKEFDKKCTSFENNSYYCEENNYYKFPLCEPYLSLMGKEVKIQNYDFDLFIVHLGNKKQSIFPLWFFSKIYNKKKTIDIE